MPKRESCASILLAPRPPSRSPPTYDPHSHSLHCRVPYSRDFVHWRFSDAGRRSAWIASSCRRPKTCTIPDLVHSGRRPLSALATIVSKRRELTVAQSRYCGSRPHSALLGLSQQILRHKNLVVVATFLL